MTRLPDEIPLIEWPEIGITLLRPTRKAAVARLWAEARHQASGGSMAAKVFAVTDAGFDPIILYAVRDTNGTLVAAPITLQTPTQRKRITRNAMWMESGGTIPSSIFYRRPPLGTRNAMLWFIRHVLHRGIGFKCLPGMDLPAPSWYKPLSDDMVSDHRKQISDRTITVDVGKRPWLVKQRLDTLRQSSPVWPSDSSGKYGGPIDLEQFVSLALTTLGIGWGRYSRRLVQEENKPPSCLVFGFAKGNVRYALEAKLLKPSAEGATIEDENRYRLAFHIWLFPDGTKDDTSSEAAILIGSGPDVYSAFVDAELLSLTRQDSIDWYNGHAEIDPGVILDPLDATQVAFGLLPSLASPQREWIAMVEANRETVAAMAQENQ